MKFAGNSVEMSCTLVLTEKEVQMLAWLAGYDPKAISKAITGEITSKFPSQEWTDFWSNLRTELERTQNHFGDVRAVFRGTKRAAVLEKTA